MDRVKFDPDYIWPEPEFFRQDRRQDPPGMNASRERRKQARRGLKVGLLGGSFNPAHIGHRHISLLALKRLQLDEVWWLVSPQNPLKPSADMAPYAERLASSRSMATHPRIRVSEAESELETRYTVDSLRALRRRHPQHRFVWIMGADNMIQVTEWHQWHAIFEAVPVAVFDRPTYSFKALAGTAAQRYARQRLKENEGGILAETAPPAWIFLWGSNDPMSATALREAAATQ